MELIYREKPFNNRSSGVKKGNITNWVWLANTFMFNAWMSETERTHPFPIPEDSAVVNPELT